jgi:hypothetical protein
MGWDGMDWIELAQDRDQWGSCEHGDKPSGSLKCWEVPEWLHNGTFSGTAELRK